MHPIPVLDPLALIALTSVLVSVVLSRARLPTTAGLLAAGAILGPYGLALVPDRVLIETLAEVGVILLLFTVGLEFPLESLKRVFRTAFVGGLLQVVITAVATALIARTLDLPWPKAIFYGLVLSLSSTAIVIRSLQDRNELEAPHGRFVVGVLLVQDLAVVPMVLLIPALAGTGEGALTLVGTALLKAVALVVGTLTIAGFVAPRVFGWIAATRSREVFLLFVISLCIGMAWATGHSGLSTALGAFLAGVIVAGTEFRHRAMSDVLPLRDIFASVFFVSLGMLFDWRVAFDHPIGLAALVGGLILIKGLAATLAALVMGFPARIARLSGAALAQFSEFGFVLVGLGMTAGLVVEQEVHDFLAAGIITMFFSPILARIAPHVTAGESLLRPLERIMGAKGADEANEERHDLSDHVVLFGFGVAGRLVGRALDNLGVTYVVVELNAETVRVARASGVPAYYGDATSLEVLEHVHVGAARAIVLAINDADAARRSLAAIRRASEGVPIVVRTKFLGDHELLTKLGASRVVADEAFAGTELVRQALSVSGFEDSTVLRATHAAEESIADLRVTLPRRS